MQPQASATDNAETKPGHYRVALRWGDMDALGHVNQAVYHELLEEGRTALFRTLPSPPKGAFVLAHVELNYRREIPLAHRHVDVTMHVEAVGRSSITLGHEVIRSDGELAADGHSVLVAWDAERRRSRPLSDGELAAIHRLEAAAQPAPSAGQ